MLHPFRLGFSSNFSSSDSPTSQRSSHDIPSSSHYSSAFVQALQSRSLTEADYEMLLNLDSQTTPFTMPLSIPNDAPNHTRHPRPMRSRVKSHPKCDRVGHVSPNLQVEPLDNSHPLLVGGACCGMCRKPYVRGDWVTTLQCKHEVRYILPISKNYF